MRRWAVWATLAALVWTCEGAGEGGKENFLVVGYLPEYRHFDTEERWKETLEKLTHVILFSIEATGDGGLSSLDRLPSNLARVKQWASDADTSILVCIGGAGRSAGLAEALADESSRNNLIRNLFDLVESLGLSGVDVNWESPGSDVEYERLHQLVLGLKRASPSTLVTVAIHPGQEEMLLRHSILDVVDFVSEMAYDNLCSIPRTTPPCKHSTFEFSEFVTRHLQQVGVDLSKVLMGLPFYGRDMYKGGAKAYYELGDAGEGDEVDGYFFNNHQTLEAKVDLARSRKMAGVMIWELGQDRGRESGRSLLAGLGDYVNSFETRLERRRNKRRKRGSAGREEL
ncbi:glycoside hydrolase [Chloropicon primus]|uniref:Glycoside hydrolase n=1 Tax=Chloropicon primus TaxID=1764295 RepID=A0A5B8MJZ3_9CHLO|nr:glycoside hydrolase [Chloropicon primus]|eukprot:QDZ20601.1 glycoside hydrolase [Chloropicon primus]